MAEKRQTVKSKTEDLVHLALDHLYSKSPQTWRPTEWQTLVALLKATNGIKGTTSEEDELEEQVKQMSTDEIWKALQSTNGKGSAQTS